MALCRHFDWRIVTLKFIIKDHFKLKRVRLRNFLYSKRMSSWNFFQADTINGDSRVMFPIFYRTASNYYKKGFTIWQNPNQFIYKFNAINMRTNMPINLVFSPLRSNFIKPPNFLFFSLSYTTSLRVYTVRSNQNINKKAVISKKRHPHFLQSFFGYKGNFKVPRKIATHIASGVI